MGTKRLKKQQTMNWDGILTNNKSEKRILSRLYKELTKLIVRKQMTH